MGAKTFLGFVFGEYDIKIRNGRCRADFSRKADDQRLSVQLKIRKEKTECFGMIGITGYIKPEK